MTPELRTAIHEAEKLLLYGRPYQEAVDLAILGEWWRDAFLASLSQLVPTYEFLRRLLNPEDLGWAVTEEVRDEARRLLDIPIRPSKLR